MPRRPVPRRPRRPSLISHSAHPAPDDRPVITLGSPGELATAVPVLCGFVPTESLVVLSLRGPRQRVGLTMRLDLAWADSVAGAPDEIAERLVLDGASAVVLVLFSDLPDPGPVRPAAPARARRGTACRARADLVGEVDAACATRGVELTEAVLVRRSRWWSYLCEGPCCPDDGVLLDTAPTPALHLLGATTALDGRRVLASREELVRSVAAPQLLAAAVARRHLDQATVEHRACRRRDGPKIASREALAVARTALGQSTTAAGVAPDVAARLAVGVHDALVRDEIATWVLSRPDALLAALEQSVRQMVPPEDAELCALLAWAAYAEGDGGLANVALERALASDPVCSLAVLVRDGLDAQLPPSAVRDVLEETRRELQVRTPG